ncbi:MAG: thiamine phosphate synthase [Candidatus Cloacimonetes bacterium HGW-Cloacimonetes-1]|jgi:thiamine-phosphate pyrophosphorylase|nr:MAG: thiamine phosphate synthase [Candidatus Cloacimonetes bacterium HGW-Cloacimonetes-1]
MLQDFGLYIVMTKPVLGYNAFTQICVEEAIPMLQLRDKHFGDRALYELSCELQGITKGSETRFILNDNPLVAQLAGVDGLHLGPEDLSPQHALQVYSAKRILGLSSHSTAEATSIIGDYHNASYGIKPDYLSFGPIFPTPTKAIPDAPVGTDQLKSVISIAPMPIVAIGGIYPENIISVLQTGARNIAMVRYFMQADSKSELRLRITEIRSIIKENR